MAELFVELQSQMIHHDVIEGLSEYVALLQTLDHRDRAMRKNICRPGFLQHRFNPEILVHPGPAPNKSSTSTNSVMVSEIDKH